jgi:hypothetical protein
MPSLTSYVVDALRDAPADSYSAFLKQNGLRITFLDLRQSDVEGSNTVLRLVPMAVHLCPVLIHLCYRGIKVAWRPIIGLNHPSLEYVDVWRNDPYALGMLRKSRRDIKDFHTLTALKRLRSLDSTLAILSDLPTLLPPHIHAGDGLSAHCILGAHILEGPHGVFIDGGLIRLDAKWVDNLGEDGDATSDVTSGSYLSLTEDCCYQDSDSSSCDTTSDEGEDEEELWEETAEQMNRSDIMDVFNSFEPVALVEANDD